MLFFQDQDRFWEWSYLWVKHVIHRRNKAEELASELRFMDWHYKGGHDDAPDKVFAYLEETVSQTEVRVLQAARTLDRKFARQFYDATLGKRTKMTMAGYALMVLAALSRNVARVFLGFL